MNAETFRAICARIAEGERIHAACSAEGSTWRNLWETKHADTDLAALYARARATAGTAFEERAAEKAEGATPETVQVARLQVDTLKWRSAMADPKGHGRKLDVTTGGKPFSPVALLPAKDEPPLGG